MYNNKKIKLGLCILVFSMIFMGFKWSSLSAYEADKKLINISDIQIMPVKNGMTEVRGSVTNKSNSNCNMCVRLKFYKDGNLIYKKDVQIVDLYIGKTIRYAHFIEGIDITDTTYTVTFAHFFIYDK